MACPIQNPLSPDDKYDSGLFATALQVVKQFSVVGVISMLEPEQNCGAVCPKTLFVVNKVIKSIVNKSMCGTVLYPGAV